MSIPGLTLPKYFESFKRSCFVIDLGDCRWEANSALNSCSEELHLDGSFALTPLFQLNQNENIDFSLDFYR